MPQLIKPATKVRIVPKEGELEITININISVDGKVTATSDGASSVVVEEDKAPHIIPDFASGYKLNFGKKEG